MRGLALAAGDRSLARILAFVLLQFFEAIGDGSLRIIQVLHNRTFLDHMTGLLAFNRLVQGRDDQANFES